RRVGQILLVRVVFAFTTDQKESSKNHHAQHIRFHGFLPRQSADGLSHHPPSTCLASGFDLAPELKFKILQPEANHANKKGPRGKPRPFCGWSTQNGTSSGWAPSGAVSGT